MSSEYEHDVVHLAVGEADSLYLVLVGKHGVRRLRLVELGTIRRGETHYKFKTPQGQTVTLQVEDDVDELRRSAVTLRELYEALRQHVEANPDGEELDQHAVVRLSVNDEDDLHVGGLRSLSVEQGCADHPALILTADDSPDEAPQESDEGGGDA